MTIAADPKLLAPYGLQGDEGLEALGVDVRPLRSSWRLRADRRRAVRTACRLRAVERPEVSAVATVSCGTAVTASPAMGAQTGGSGRPTRKPSREPEALAVFEIPTPEPGGPHEGNRLGADQVGVLAVPPSAGGATVRVTSGRYTFSAVNACANRLQSGRPMTAPSSRENS